MILWGGPLDGQPAPERFLQAYSVAGFPWPGGWYVRRFGNTRLEWYEEPGVYTREDHRMWCKLTGRYVRYPNRFRGCSA